MVVTMCCCDHAVALVLCATGKHPRDSEGRLGGSSRFLSVISVNPKYDCCLPMYIKEYVRLPTATCEKEILELRAENESRKVRRIEARHPVGLAAVLSVLQ